MTVAPDVRAMATPPRDLLEETLIGRSQEMVMVRALVRRAMESDVPVLIEGQTGTGKEIVAQALHAHGQRRGRLVALNVAELRQELAEAELFGVVRGAFTGATDRPGRIEQADGGTLFLDEAADLPRSLQARLLRVLESGVYSRVGEPRERTAAFRLIVTVQTPPGQLVTAQRWRPDFLYRVGRLHLVLPPLVDRGEDIAYLANHFLARFGMPPLPQAASFELLEHEWPGNVRELASAVERAVFAHPGKSIDAQDILAAGRSLLTADGTAGLPLEPQLSSRLRIARLGIRIETVRAAERKHVEEVLQRHGFQVRLAANALGMSKASLYRRIRELGITLPKRVRDRSRSLISETSRLK